MPNRRRYLISKQTYEITIRAKEGLPFPPADYMNLLILSALARVQRDSKVVISHFVVMSNHIHFLVVVYDQQQAINFLQEIKRKLTEVVKRVLGMKQLTLWEDSSIILYPTEEDIRYRIAYFYSNPAKAGLESSIDQYPGISSWEAFQKSSSSVSDEVTLSCPWITADNIPIIKQGVGPQKDAEIVKALKATSRISHNLVIRPNEWMKSFLIPDEHVRIINDDISKAVREEEALLADLRRKEERGILGKDALKNKAPTVSGHRPKKKGRRIFIVCHDGKIRQQFIDAYNKICEMCIDCYLWYRKTLEIPMWPPGTFMPPLPPRVSTLSIY